jgi:hypothetical protein
MSLGVLDLCVVHLHELEHYYKAVSQCSGALDQFPINSQVVHSIEAAYFLAPHLQ